MLPSPDPTQLVGALLFALALIHTFSTKVFERLARSRPAHAGLWHLLGEVEVVFGFWAMVLVVFLMVTQGRAQAVAYLDGRNYTEPLFVFAIMVVAGTRPVLQAAADAVRVLSRPLPLPSGMAMVFVVLSLVPLLGSFITEPAAMTLAAMMLRDGLFNQPVSTRLKYAALGALFVNISIGGTLTPYAAPPVLMVAAAWDWDLAYTLTTLGWRAAVAVLVNAAGLVLLFRVQLSRLEVSDAPAGPGVPWSVRGVHLLFLAGVVVFAHHPPVFLGLLLFFMGYASAYPRHQDTLILREALLVAFFLSGLVVLGGLQSWWLQPLLLRLDAGSVFFGAAALTAITDNAALTYLASLVPGLTDEFKLAVVAGAVAGGGLTVIANAPNPAGMAILRSSFEDETVHPLGLLAGAALPTLVAIAAFRLF